LQVEREEEEEEEKTAEIGEHLMLECEHLMLE